MMTVYAQTQSGQTKPLTLDEAKSLLRASLDREKLTSDQLDAATAHIASLDKEIKDAKADKEINMERIANLAEQKGEAVGEAKNLRTALDEQRAATAQLKTDLARAEGEVTRQKGKVSAANRRTLWALFGGLLIGALAAVAASK